MKLRDSLKGIIPEEKLSYVPSSYEIIGSRQKAVAIIEIPEELTEFKQAVANALMNLHKNVKSVLVKKSERKGELRLREFEVFGDKNTEVLHKEHGYLVKIDPTKAYFSPREATERQRIASQVRPGETVMVMFSGVAPYAIAIAKKQPKVKKVICIELNEHAHKYAVENVRINKLEDKIILINGDVREESKRFFGMCDRVVMPLPKGAYKFLDEAFSCIKEKGGVIHFYHWAPEEDLFSDEGD